MKTMISAVAVVLLACVCLAMAAHQLHHWCMSKADVANSPAMIATAKAQNAFLNAVGF